MELFYRYDQKQGPIASGNQPVDPERLRVLGDILVTNEQGSFMWKVYSDDKTGEWWAKRGKNGCAS